MAAEDVTATGPQRLLEVAARLAAEGEEARRRLAELDVAIEALAARVGVDPGAPPLTRATAAPVVASPAEPVAEVAPPAVPEPAPAPAPAVLDGARLVAIEMAVGGATRGAVGDRLRREFGVAEPTPVLDDVFGAGTADESRMPWGG